MFKDQGYSKAVCNFDLYMTVEFQVELQAFSLPLYFCYRPMLSVELQVQGCVVGKTRAIMWEAQGKDSSGWNTCSIWIQVIFQRKDGYLKMFVFSWITFKLQNFIFKVFLNVSNYEYCKRTLIKMFEFDLFCINYSHINIVDIDHKVLFSICYVQISSLNKYHMEYLWWIS